MRRRGCRASVVLFRDHLRPEQPLVQELRHHLHVRSVRAAAPRLWRCRPPPRRTCPSRSRRARDCYTRASSRRSAATIACNTESRCPARSSPCRRRTGLRAPRRGCACRARALEASQSQADSVVISAASNRVYTRKQVLVGADGDLERRVAGLVGGYGRHAASASSAKLPIEIASSCRLRQPLRRASRASLVRSMKRCQTGVPKPRGCSSHGRRPRARACYIAAVIRS